MNYALSELEARHHRKELAIMERMEQLELVRRQLQLALSWPDLGESDNYLCCRGENHPALLHRVQPLP